LILVQASPLDMIDDWVGDKISHTHIPFNMQPDLRTAHIVLEHLLYDVDVLPPLLQSRERPDDIRSMSFDHKDAEPVKNMVKVIWAPYIR